MTISRVYSDADMTVNTYTDDKNRTQSAGFIGNLTGKSSVEYVFAAGKVDNKTSEQLYNFIGTPDALKTMVKNSFVIQNAGGVSNITDGVGQEILREVTSQEAATSDFYKTSNDSERRDMELEFSSDERLSGTEKEWRSERSSP